ncbi:armadillo-type protein [Haematococcus lacustris]
MDTGGAAAAAVGRRAIVDEVLPPAFLTQVLSGLRSESLGVSVVKSAGSMLSARHGAERLVNAWQGGALTLDQVESQITALLEEYLAGARDAGEACRCLTELRVPDHHHALVKMALEHVFMQPKSEDDVLALLASLAASGVISQTQMTKGFDLVQSNLAEEALDYGPAATALYATIADKATRAGWLVPS